MDLATRDQKWANLSRWLILTMGGILILSLIDLILAAVWGAKVAKLSPGAKHQMSSSSELVFYAGTLPFLTIIWAAASLGLTLAKVLAPIAALASSVVLFCGWIPQIGIWLYCEVGAPNVNEHVPNWCPTSPINTAKDSYNVAYNVGLGKDFLGLVIAVALIASIILVAIAMSRRRKRGMEDHVLKTVPVDSPVLTS